MGTVKAFQVAGCRVVFRVTDEHPPPHFHLSNDDYEIRVFVLTTTGKALDYTFKRPPNGVKIPSRFLKEVAQLVDVHREALIEQWEAEVVPGLRTPQSKSVSSVQPIKSKTLRGR